MIDFECQGKSMSKTHVMALCLAAAVAVSACAVPQANQGVAVSQTARGVQIRSSDSILFDSGQYEVKASARPFLDQMASLLITRTRSNVLIEGHTDSVGGRDFNQDLSELRALSVMKALVDRGVPKTRIKAVGYGMSRPLADNATQAGRQANRRTDIILLGEKQENLGQDPFKGMVDSVVSFGKGLFK